MRDALLACGRLTIDLDALADNWRHLRALVSRGQAACECAAVVKADAYGITIGQAVTALSSAGCKSYFVATPEEGIGVRSCNADAVIYILNGLLPAASAVYLAHRLRPVLNTRAEMEEWAAQGEGAPAALHVDTGMNRLGLSEDEARIFSQDTALRQRLNLSLLISHLACADTPGALMNGCQLSAFTNIAALFPDLARSLANSAGIFNGAAFHLDMVRPGVALYGGAALNEHIGANVMKPVVTAEARIVQIRHVGKDESVGYSGAETLDRPSLIAIVSAGYADGYLRRSGSTTRTKGALAFVNGHFVPLVGRVSMDLIALDVTDAGTLKRGDFVELFGPNVPVSVLARYAETIDYEFLTGLGKRYHRSYGPLGE